MITQEYLVVFFPLYLNILRKVTQRQISDHYNKEFPDRVAPSWWALKRKTVLVLERSVYGPDRRVKSLRHPQTADI